MTPDMLRSDLVRAFDLADVEIERSGDGRTVVAYATPFNVETEIHDQHGHYVERYSATSFDKTAREAIKSGVVVLYNHGKDLHGNAAPSFAVPIGTPIEIRPDGRGLLTRTRYLDTELGNAILDAVREGGLKSYSHTSTVIRSAHVSNRGRLPVFEHREMRLREYGPTPLPHVLAGAEILAVRSTTLADALRNVTPDELDALDPTARGELARIIGVESDTSPPAPPPEGTPPGTPPAPAEPAGDAAPPGTSTEQDPPDLSRVKAMQRDQELRRRRIH